MHTAVLRRVFWLAAFAMPAAAGLAATDEPKQAQDVAKSDKVAGKKDPVADAFALPRGVVLRGDQQQAYDQMKQREEPRLRKALQDVASAATEVDKTKTAREALKIRAEIRRQIKTILNTPPPDSHAAKSPAPHRHPAHRPARRR